MKVTGIMCTYGRFKHAERSLTMFLDQDYQNKELIIFNTAPAPLQLSEALLGGKVHVINNQLDYETGLPYTNVGAVRRDSITHGDGDLYYSHDDDDWYMPYNISRGVECFKKTGKIAWKPRYSYYSPDGGVSLSKVENNMEATIFFDYGFVRENGFKKETGSEHCNLLDKLRGMKELSEKDDVAPSYTYVWGQGLHVQSGSIGDPNNFENHKKRSTDFGDVPLKRVDNSWIYSVMSEQNKLNGY